MLLKIKNIKIKNFKSLNDSEVKISKLNVIVGKNSSGKTNLVEAFMLLKNVYKNFDKKNPFSYWWGYENATYKHNSFFPITIEMEFSCETIKGDTKKRYPIVFRTNISGVGGKLDIQREEIEIKNKVHIVKEGEWVEVIHNKEYYAQVVETMEEMLKKDKNTERVLPIAKKIIKNKMDFISQSIRGVDVESLLHIPTYAHMYYLKDGNSIISPFGIKSKIGMKDKGKDILVISPTSISKSEDMPGSTTGPMIINFIEELNRFFDKLTILKINVQKTKEPNIIKKDTNITETGDNLSTVLHTLFLDRNKLPKNIQNFLYNNFPNLELRFSLTDDQRVFLKILEEGTEIPPPCAPDGLFKALTVLTATELNPSILVIDEIDNSLHPELLSYVLDELRNCNCPVIITTHSPVTVDMVDLTELIFAEKTPDGTKFRRIKDVGKVKKLLKDQGLTHSEGWLYGELKT